jgi:putative FmdB family regulatory protein
MPLYTYIAKYSNKCCEYCCNAFELLQNLSSREIKKCPECGAPVKKRITNFSIGISKSALDGKHERKGFISSKD